MNSLLNEAPAKSVTHNTFVIERTYPVAPERVFAAFAEASTKRRWYADGKGHDIESFEMDFRPGGVERSRYLMRVGTPSLATRSPARGPTRTSSPTAASSPHLP